MANNSLTELSMSKMSTLLSFCQTLIFKNPDKADENETSKALTQSSLLINACLQIQHPEFTFDVNDPVARNKFIADYHANTVILYNNIKNGTTPPSDLGYAEWNKYYRDLYVEKGIDIFTSRTARQLEIIGWSEGYLSANELLKFKSLYITCLNYYMKTTYTAAFKTQENYFMFCALMVVIQTINEYLAQDMESVFNLELMDQYGVINLLYSYGIYFLDKLAPTYQKRVIRNIEKLLVTKGTDQIFETVLSIFGFDNVESFRHYLIKTPKEDESGNVDLTKFDLKFLRVPFEQTSVEKYVTEEKALTFTEYDIMVADDDTWKATKEEILDYEFNAVQTKYFDIQSSLNIQKNMSELAYFYNTLHSLRLSGTSSSLVYYSTTYSDTPINVFDALVALGVLVIDLAGFEPVILKHKEDYDAVQYMTDRYVYSSSMEVMNGFGFVDEITTTSVSETFLNDYGLAKYTSVNAMKVLATPEEVFGAIHNNLALKETLEARLANETSWVKFDQLQKDYMYLYHTEVNRLVFENYTDYMSYLRKSNVDLASYIANTIERADPDYSRLTFNGIASDLEVFINSEKFKPGSLNNDYILEYVEKLVDYFKSYTIQLKNLNFFYRFDSPFLQSVHLLDNLIAQPATVYMSNAASLKDSITEKLAWFRFKDSIRRNLLDYYVYNGKIHRDDMFTLDNQLEVFRGIIQESAPLGLKIDYHYVSWREEFEDSIRRTMIDEYTANPALIEVKLIFKLLDKLSEKGVIYKTTLLELYDKTESLKFFFDKDGLRHGMLDYLTILYRSIQSKSELNTIIDELNTETVDVKDSLLTQLSVGFELTTLNKGIQRDSIRRNLSDRFTKTVI